VAGQQFACRDNPRRSKSYRRLSPMTWSNGQRDTSRSALLLDDEVCYRLKSRVACTVLAEIYTCFREGLDLQRTRIGTTPELLRS
jgi:hypothetical protein